MSNFMRSWTKMWTSERHQSFLVENNGLHSCLINHMARVWFPLPTILFSRTSHFYLMVLCEKTEHNMGNQKLTVATSSNLSRWTHRLEARRIKSFGVKTTWDMNPSKETKNEIKASVCNSIRALTVRNCIEEWMTGHTFACEHGCVCQCVGVYKCMFNRVCVGGMWVRVFVLLA